MAAVDSRCSCQRDHAEGGADPVLLPPRWLPQRVSRANGLAGMLAFSPFANRIRLETLDEAPVLSLD